MGEDARKVRIGKTEVGLYALEEIFEEMRRSGFEGENLTDELLRLVSIYNYVPGNMTEQYRAAVAQEYESYLEKAEERGT